MKLLQVCKNHTHHPVKRSCLREDQTQQHQHLSEIRGCRCYLALFKCENVSEVNLRAISQNPSQSQLADQQRTAVFASGS